MMSAGSVVTVGTFDGVHRGHHAVLEEIARRARRAHRRSVLVTFEPHPLEVVNPQAAPLRLTTADERLEYLAQSELDLLAVIPFTTELSKLSPREFVQVLRTRYNLRELVIGHDHGFGKGRAGDEHVIRALGRELGFAVDVVEAVGVDGRPMSSSLARRAIAGGDLGTAEDILGRPYSILGTVAPGAGRGRRVGYRTINVPVADARKLLPPDGVYAVRVEWRDGVAGGMMNQGGRPTFGEMDRILETHLFDTEVELYGEPVKISWLERLRDTCRFPSPEALKTQLDKDLQAARAALTRSGITASH